MFKQSREVRALRRLQGTSECSVIHPRGHPSSSHAGSKAQSSAAHGKIADKIPHQRHKLHNGRKEGQDSGMEPDGKVNRHHDGTEVSCGEGQSRARHQVHGILVRAHQDSPGCDEKHRANRPPIKDASATHASASKHMHRSEILHCQINHTPGLLAKVHARYRRADIITGLRAVTWPLDQSEVVCSHKLQGWEGKV